MPQNDERSKLTVAYPIGDGDIGIRVENLDSMLNPDDCAYAAESYEGVAEQFKTLAEYARAKSHAMKWRAAGKIDRALEIERECERLYQTLDRRFRW